MRLTDALIDVQPATSKQQKTKKQSICREGPPELDHPILDYYSKAAELT